MGKNNIPVLTEENTFKEDQVVEGGLTIDGIVVIMSALPTSDPVNAGQLWNNSNVLTISVGS